MPELQQELHHLSIHEAGHLLSTRQLSPVELTRAYLERIEAVDPAVRAYVAVLADAALAQARTAEAEILAGRYRGLLHGIPVAFKDLIDIQGVRTTAQSRVMEHRVADADASVVLRLREAGAVLLGKLAMGEFALGDMNSLFGPTHNPWNLDYGTGGSSSGCGAAIAAGLCMGALGTDSGGSIRGPAALCGIVGLKPTYGRVSRHGVVPLSWSLDHCGPMTWTVEDAAIMLQVIAGYDAKDPTSVQAPVPVYPDLLDQDLQGLKIGVPRHYFFAGDAGVGAETQDVVNVALAELEGLGASLVEVHIPTLEHAVTANTIIMLSEGFAYHKDNLAVKPEMFGDTVRSRLYLGSLFSVSDYLQAQRVRSKLRFEFAQMFQRVDVIAGPTKGRPAAPLSAEGADALAVMGRPSFCSPFDQTGLPALSIPCGFNKDGLPIGLQVAGKPFDEALVLRVGHAYQEQARWHERRPLPPSGREGLGSPC